VEVLVTEKEAQVQRVAARGVVVVGTGIMIHNDSGLVAGHKADGQVNVVATGAAVQGQDAPDSDEESDQGRVPTRRAAAVSKENLPGSLAATGRGGEGGGCRRGPRHWPRRRSRRPTRLVMDASSRSMALWCSDGPVLGGHDCIFRPCFDRKWAQHKSDGRCVTGNNAKSCGALGRDHVSNK
jgi:hypothetical protein